MQKPKRQNKSKEKKMSKVIETEVVEEVKAPVLVNFQSPVPVIEVEKLLAEYSNIPDIDPESPEADEQYKFVRKGHLAFVNARTSIEKKRKEISDPAFQFHKAVISAAKEVQELLSPTELKLKAQRDKVEHYAEEKRIEAELKEEARKDAHRKNISAISQLPLQHYTSSSEIIMGIIESYPVPSDETFEEFVDDALSAYTTTMQQLTAAYENKVKAEQADAIQAQRDKEAAELEAQRQEQMRKERESFEQGKAALQRERDQLERERKAQQEAIDLQRAEMEAEQLMIKQKAEREEQEKAKELARMELEKADKKAKQEKEKADKRLFEKRVNETLEMLIAYSGHSTPDMLLDAIINGDIINVKWAPDER